MGKVPSELFNDSFISDENNFFIQLNFALIFLLEEVDHRELKLHYYHPPSAIYH